MDFSPNSTISADEQILDVTADPDAQIDGLERLKELARRASPEKRTRIERTIAAVAHARQIRSMAAKAVEQRSLLEEAHNMDEEMRSLAKAHSLDNGPASERLSKK